MTSHGAYDATERPSCAKSRTPPADRFGVVEVRSILAVVILAVTLGLSLAGPAKAAGSVYYVKPSGAGITCSEWLAACDLQTALELAGSGDEIWLAAGTHTLTEDSPTFEIGDGITVYGGFAGNETSLGQRDIAGNPTILTGDSNGPDKPGGVIALHVVTVGPGATVTLDGITVAGGYAAGPEDNPTGWGGGIYSNGTLALRNVTLDGNYARFGGGLYTTGDTTIEASAVVNNWGWRGAGAAVEGGSLTVSNTTFAANVGYTGLGLGNEPSRGGGVFALGTAVATVENVTFAHNYAHLGSSIGMQDSAAMTVRNSLLANPVKIHPKINGAELALLDGTTLAVHDTAVRSGCVSTTGLTCDNAVDVPSVTSALADNGGPTLTVDPAGEPAIAPLVIDQGDDATCTAIDQRGVPRPFEGDGTAPNHCDRGAVEHVPLAIEFAATSSQQAEGAGLVNLEVTLENSFLDQVSVDYAMAGTASSPADYAPASGTLTFEPGDTSEMVTLDVVDDKLDEDDETVVITLSQPVIGTLGTDSVATHTILDDDAAPDAQFAATSGSASESRLHPGVLVVTLSRRSGRTVTVPYLAKPGSARAARDYRLPAGTLTIPAGVTRMKVPLEIIDDLVVEPAESMTVALGTPTNAALGTRRKFDYVILDNDRGTCDGHAATMAGTADGETITGTPGIDVIAAGGGNDIVDGRGGADIICGDDGRDEIEGGAGRDSLFGGDGADLLNGGDAGDHLDGGGANDRLHGDAGNDDLSGAGGNDRLFGDGGDDELAGGGGNSDRCNGGPGIDGSGANDGCEVLIGVP